MKPPEKQEISCQNKIKIDRTACHQRGLIPGPTETSEAFLRRVNSVKVGAEHPIIFFDIKPDWVPVLTKKGLPFWEGATTWIEEIEGHPRTCSIQLRPSASFLYTKEEILSHELVHATRLLFDEPRFEEILAYCTSKNPLRRYCGPLFTRALESLLFVILLVVSWAFYSVDLFFAEGELGNYALGLPILGLLFCLIRLARSQWLFSKALKAVKGVVKSPENALTAMLYLTDEEIKQFAGKSKEEIEAYVQEHRGRSLRLEQFASNYFYVNRSKSKNNRIIG